MIVDTAVTVARPREQVFDRMADVRNEAEWNSQVSRSDLVSGEPIGLGTTFLTVNRGQAYDATITTYDRPNEISFDVVGNTLPLMGPMIRRSFPKELARFKAFCESR